MFKIPYADLISTIKEKSGISEEEIERKVKDKLEQLSGLISKEGAAHIVANELGIKLLEPTSGKLQIKNVLPGMRDVETHAKVLQVYELRQFKSGERQGQVASTLVGDETGTMRVVMWGNQAENSLKLRPGDVLGIKGGYVKENQGRKEIHLNEKAQVMINPPGVEIKEVAQTQQQSTSPRKNIKELTEQDRNVEVLGTVVQVFEPRFFEVDPNSGRRIRPNAENKFFNEKGEEVVPDHSYVLNAVIDDGTESIRGVFFRDQATKLLNIDHTRMITYKEDPSTFEDMKTELLGTITKVAGKVAKNDMFDRLEIVARDVTINPNPEEELKRLEK